MSWKARLGIGLLLLVLALMVLSIVKQVVALILPLAILLLVGYGAARLYLGSKRGSTETPEPPQAQLPKQVPPRNQVPDGAAKLREIRDEMRAEGGRYGDTG